MEGHPWPDMFLEARENPFRRTPGEQAFTECCKPTEINFVRDPTSCIRLFLACRPRCERFGVKQKDLQIWE